MAEGILIRAARGAAEHPLLVAVWRSSVAATHRFLAEEHRAAIEGRLAADYLPNVRLVVAEHAVVSVDVNEQNEQAAGFYARAGFAVDGRGWPYPLLHLTLAPEPDAARPRLADESAEMPSRMRWEAG